MSDENNDFWGSDNQSDFWDTGITPDTQSQSTQTDEQPVSSDDFWGSDNNDSQSDYWANQSQYESSSYNDTPSDTPPKLPIQTNLGYKSVAVIIAVAFVILALILAFVNGIRVKKKNTAQATQTVATTEQSVKTDTTTGTTLITIPSSTDLDYTGDVYESSGTVTEKQKYLINNQVVYDLVITINAGATTQRVDFYCTYSAFDSCSVGDLIQVKYQVVEEGYISVSEINKY